MSELKVYPRPPRISGASQRGLVAAMLDSTALSSITRDRLKSQTWRPRARPAPAQRPPVSPGARPGAPGGRAVQHGRCRRREAAARLAATASQHGGTQSQGGLGGANGATQAVHGEKHGGTLWSSRRSTAGAHLHAPVLVDQQIGRLEVAVDDRRVRRVQVVHALGRVQRHRQPARPRRRPSGSSERAGAATRAQAPHWRPQRLPGRWLLPPLGVSAARAPSMAARCACPAGSGLDRVLSGKCPRARPPRPRLTEAAVGPARPGRRRRAIG